jgi:hypothetical protein
MMDVLVRFQRDICSEHHNDTTQTWRSYLRVREAAIAALSPFPEMLFLPEIWTSVSIHRPVVLDLGSGVPRGRGVNPTPEILKFCQLQIEWNPWQGATAPPSLFSLLNPPPLRKNPGYATGPWIIYEPGQRGRYKDSLRDGRYRDRISVQDRFFAPVHSDPEARPVSCIIDNGSLAGGKAAGACRRPPTSI